MAILMATPSATFSLLAAVLTMAAGSLGHAADAVTKEYKLKAAFIYNFAKFVEWPASSFPNAGSPIVIGILGGNPFGEELSNTVKDRRIRGRSLEIRHVGTAAQAKGTQVLFVGAGEERNFGSIRNALGAGVLTVGESPQFAKQGGTINFLQQGNKLRFEINMADANRRGLKVSAQLQKLATTIHR